MDVSPAPVASLSRLLTEAAQAHHDAKPGPDPEWPRWYAIFLEGKIDHLIGGRPDVGEIAEALAVAHQRHQSEAPHRPWPEFYARVMLGLED